ncbi:hypothetical protein BJF95_05990 [Rhizobium oryziradicis]|uniref:Uncharacterized protein n=1 Tax=Rhizobium oryziradicis TaxID=1867956 RepID=A0A1Q8ZPU9_9HYPH|nr:hypothetical protein BJF95_05990 [Rhizobium oryziradicis]
MSAQVSCRKTLLQNVRGPWQSFPKAPKLPFQPEFWSKEGVRRTNHRSAIKTSLSLMFGYHGGFCIKFYRPRVQSWQPMIRQAARVALKRGRA